MSDIIQVLSIVIKIIIFPKKIASSSSLGKYNVKIAKCIIFFLSLVLSIIISIVSFDLRLYSTKWFAQIFISSMIIFFVSTLGHIYVYYKLINILIESDINYKIIEKLLLPYIINLLLFSILLKLISYCWVIKNYYIVTLLFIWFNMQVYYNIKYRIGIVKFNKQFIVNNIKKIFVLSVAITVLGGTNYLINTPEFKIKMRESRSGVSIKENPIIRMEVYETCQELYNEIEFKMKEEQGIYGSEEYQMKRKLRYLLVDLGSFRDNERLLHNIISEMIDINIAWYQAKSHERIEEMKIQYNKYIEAATEAQRLIDNYAEKEKTQGKNKTKKHKGTGSLKQRKHKGTKHRGTGSLCWKIRTSIRPNKGTVHSFDVGV